MSRHGEQLYPRAILDALRKRKAAAEADEGLALIGVVSPSGHISFARMDADELDTLIDELIGVYAQIAPTGVAGSDRLEGTHS